MFFLLQILSCYQNETDETRHPLFIKAINEKNNGNYRESERLFNDFLNLNPMSLKTHLELAFLYHEKLNSPIKALYHYNRYLEIAPDSSDKDDISALIISVEQKLLEELLKKNNNKISEKISEYEQEKKELIDYITKLKRENEILLKISKTELITNNSRAKNENLTLNKDTNPTPSFYIIEPGDNLSKISRKIYGSVKYVKNIYLENKDILQSEDSPLYIGMKIRLPKIQEEKDKKE